MTTSAIRQTPVDFQFKRKPSQNSSTAHKPQKPKLSINTTLHRSLGRSSSGLRLETISAASPTVRNTYSNTYENESEPPNAPDTQSFESERAIRVPYSLPSEVRSILTNGPLIIRQKTSHSYHPSKSTVVSKRVCFRDPLAEEIQTIKFVMKHSDLRSRSNSPSSRHPVTKPSSQRRSSRGSPPPVKARTRISEVSQLSIEKDADGTMSLSSSSSFSSEDEDCIDPPETPVSRRQPKEREWVWTLGHLPGIGDPGASAKEAAALNEDLDESLGETVAAASGFLSRSKVDVECK